MPGQPAFRADPTITTAGVLGLIPSLVTKGGPEKSSPDPGYPSLDIYVLFRNAR